MREKNFNKEVTRRINSVTVVITPAAAALFIAGAPVAQGAALQAAAAISRPATIGNDRGGKIIDYAMKTRRYADTGATLRFSGSCESACTLFLGLPRERLCVTPGASFGFHLPHGGDARQNRQAAEYLMRRYPKWVRDWLAARGGLSTGMKRMSHAQATAHLRPCDRRRA